VGVDKENCRSLGCARDDKGERGGLPLPLLLFERPAARIATVTPNGSATVPFVIPSEAEGSAVLLTSSRPLFLQNGFYQVARLVHIDPVLNRQLVREQLQRNDFQHGG